MSKVLKTALPKLSSPRKQPFTVFIEGNIGAGKTTFLNHFKKYEDVCLYTEPVEKWRNVQGFNLLVIFTHQLDTQIQWRKCSIRWIVFGGKMHIVDVYFLF